MAENAPRSYPSPPAEERRPNTAADPVPDDGDSVFDQISAYSDTTSLTSSILNYRKENGRTYHAYKAGSYILPNDTLENDRLDQQHHLCLLTLNDRLFISPVGKDKPLKRILDAGCGTGIWALDIGMLEVLAITS
ncbi:hypothetical protein EDB80DRAFT_150424 [Ilyonectria destructans]|nr:hypothetical protein EDB80DRAFT_150424 [Ilyonectria destructans]